ncbi:MAG: universal stress protein [Bacteroidales bacterium]|jgi:nucleotide-binding universal stress UspA family protein|nr:universal stress protein [Bacteroidales bacterium]
MENYSKPILIPADFSAVTQYAVTLAVTLAKKVDTHIVLVHIVKKTADILDATSKILHEAESFSQKYGVKVTGIVRKGSIFSTIGDTVKELDASIVFMGTHGIKGMQKVTGAWALKVVVSSSVPIIVVQGTTTGEIKRIVFPVDSKKETKEKIGWTQYIARIFESQVYLFREKVSKDKKIEQNIHSNLVFAQKYLNSRKLYYQVEVAEGAKSFTAETLDYAEKIGSDLIVITTTKGISLTDYLLGTVEEEGLLDNHAQIPVLCINPRKTKLTGGFSAMGGGA